MELAAQRAAILLSAWAAAAGFPSLAIPTVASKPPDATAAVGFPCAATLAVMASRPQAATLEPAPLAAPDATFLHAQRKNRDPRCAV